MFADRKLDPQTDYNGVFADPAAFAKKVRVLWLGVGTQEPERMRTGLLRLHAALDEAQIKHVFYESPGTDHEWQTWRRDLQDFAAETVLKHLTGVAALCVVVTISAAASSTREEADGKAAALVAQLTLDEKVDQLLNVAPAIPRLGIPAVQLVDGIPARGHRHRSDNEFSRAHRPCRNVR